MLFIYGYDLITRKIYSPRYDKNSIGLMLVYIKHILNIIITPKMKLIEYELDRVVMWSFTAPLMIKMLCDENELTMIDLKIHYHLCAIIPHIFVVPFKNTQYYLLSIIILSIPGIIFMKSLNKYRHLKFANLYILIWGIFMSINVLDISHSIHPSIIHAFYNLSDTIFKFTFNFVISNYNEQKLIMRENMDLQSVSFVSNILKSINEFEKGNVKITPTCSNLIRFFKKKFNDKIPKSNSKLKLELLKKILPFDLDGDYVSMNAKKEPGSKKEFNFICVLFMDIVNYTELAKRYTGDTIFKLLDVVYDRFDNIIKKYSHLQKIETIGDAYMVVGDIYRVELNHKVVVKEILLLGLDFIKEIKTIKTPDKIPLCIRIGITIGNVNIGILGNELPRLCCVGNAVNVASRLQSTAEKDTIQMSRHVYEHAEETDFGFAIEYVEKKNIFLKNMGSITTYNISPS